MSIDHPDLKDNEGDIWKWEETHPNYPNAGPAYVYEHCYPRSRQELEDTWGPLTEVPAVDVTDSKVISMPVVPDSVTKLVAVDGSKTWTRDEDGDWITDDSWGSYYELHEILENFGAVRMIEPTEYEKAVEFFNQNQILLTADPMFWSPTTAAKRHIQTIIKHVMEGN